MRKVLPFLLILLLFGCGSSQGGGVGFVAAAAQPGGPAGTPCNAITDGEGCSFENQVAVRVRCNNGVWVKSGACAPGQACTVLAVGSAVCQTPGSDASGSIFDSAGGLLTDAGSTVSGDGGRVRASTDGGATGGAVDTATSGPSDTATGPSDAGGSNPCVQSPYTPTAEQAAQFGKGCSTGVDLFFATELQKDPKKATSLNNAVKDCMLGSSSCASKGDTKTKEGQAQILACTAKCVRADNGGLMSMNCATCYAFGGVCPFVHCLGQCAVEANSPACKACLKCHCDPVVTACMQLPDAPLPCSCLNTECGKPKGCSNDCGSCALGKKCEQNKCVDAAVCNCANKQCGFVPGCSQSCGTCKADYACKSNQCVKTGGGGPTKAKFGEFCGASAKCKKPPTGASDAVAQAYNKCTAEQCETGLCFQDVCTKQCTISVDKLNNATGGAGADGIEDPSSKSQCANAASGIYGSNYRCALMTNTASVAAGNALYYCQPGTTFKPCKNNADCAGNQRCWLYYLKGDFSLRCGPKAQNPNGSTAGSVTSKCNTDQAAGAIKMCQNRVCTAKGCVDFCKSNADCGKWTCLKNQKVSSDSNLTVDLCWPPQATS